MKWAIAFCALAFSAGAFSAGFAWAEAPIRGLHPLDTRGAYLGGGVSDLFRKDFVTTGDGDEDYLVEYEDSQGFHGIWGYAYVSRLFRFRYEWEGYAHEVDLTIVERDANAPDTRHTGGKAGVTGGGVNLFYDFPAILSGHLAPYGGGGVFLAHLDMEIPGGVSLPASGERERFVGESVDDSLGLDDYAYGYHLAAGFRIELTRLIGVDVSGRLVRIERNARQGAVAFGAEETTEARASLIFRF